jgi:hypothetical protein
MGDHPDKAADKVADKAPDLGAAAQDGIVSDEDTTASDRSDRNAADRSDRGITDFVRRAVSAGVGAAARSKDDIMRAAATEMRNWLERLDVNNEVLKALSKMVIEVKTEIRFRPTEDGRIAPEVTNDAKVKPREG